jgi:hypothetical protein
MSEFNDGSQILAFESIEDNDAASQFRTQSETSPLLSSSQFSEMMNQLADRQLKALQEGTHSSETGMLL